MWLKNREDSAMIEILNTSKPVVSEESVGDWHKYGFVIINNKLANLSANIKSKYGYLDLDGKWYKFNIDNINLLADKKYNTIKKSEVDKNDN